MPLLKAPLRGIKRTFEKYIQTNLKVCIWLFQAQLSVKHPVSSGILHLLVLDSVFFFLAGTMHGTRGWFNGVQEASLGFVGLILVSQIFDIVCSEGTFFKFHMILFSMFPTAISKLCLKA